MNRAKAAKAIRRIRQLYPHAIGGPEARHGRIWLVLSLEESVSWPISNPTRQQRRTAATRVEQRERRPWIVEPHDAGEWRGFWRAFYALGLWRAAADRRRVEHHQARRQRAQRKARIWSLSEGA